VVDKNSVVLLREVTAAGKEYIDALLREDAPIVCINRDTKKERLISFKTLYGNNSRFWLQNETWEYFLAKEYLARIKDALTAKPAAHTLVVGDSRPKPAPAEPAPARAPPAAPDALMMENYGAEYEAIAAMSEEQRIQQIQKDKQRLDELITQKPRNTAQVTEALVDTTRDAAMVNHAAIINAMQMTDSDAKKYTQGLVDSTREMVVSGLQLVSPAIFNDELMHTLVEKSNGTVIQHMTRVYLQGVAFLSYYNRLLSTSSIINKLRVSFEETYGTFYSDLMPHVPASAFTLEKVFRGGMRIIPGEEFLNWATGFLIHDIGKASAVEYHEGEAAYNRDIVMEHVKVGYNSVMNKTNYPREAALITGYHHEYYGDPAGYGYFRTLLEQYKKAKPYAKPDNAISYEMEPIMDYRALGYFPAKALELIDVYDSVTDPNRKYRKPLPLEEALAMMREEFIEKHHKLDKILFDIFTDFVREKN
jgi:hypothetical protein